jgi:3-isopropylmalate/(R)-2-methylmalate dehydratase large subunit
MASSCSTSTPATSAAQPLTLFQKIWQQHVVDTLSDGAVLLYIDRHLVHEVTSPQAFAGLRAAGRMVRQPQFAIAMADHNVPTINRAGGIRRRLLNAGC